jgi:phospholipase/carboxylesterase
MVGYYWYDMDNLGAPEPGTYAAARAALERFVDEAMAAYQFEPASLYVLGFSQGAMMAGGLTLVRPSRLAGSVLLSGYLPADRGLQVDLTGLRHKPILVAHGAHDPVIPVQFGRAARAELTRLGADVTYREYPIEHSISLDELADVAAWLAAQLDRTTGAKRQRSDS